MDPINIQRYISKLRYLSHSEVLLNLVTNLRPFSKIECAKDLLTLFCVGTH